MIQGCRQSLICSYVFDELPKIYKMVCNNKPVKMEEIARGKKTSFVKCDQCKYKSSMIQMKMHIKSIHKTSRSKVNKRLSNFTPIVKPSKKSKHGIPSKLNLLLNADDTFSGKETPLQKSISGPMECDATIEPEMQDEVKGE